VLARLKTFQAHTEPVIRFYRRSALFEVDGTGTVQSVAARVIAASVEIKKRLIPSKRAAQFGEPFKIDSAGSCSSSQRKSSWRSSFAALHLNASPVQAIRS
jgi:hypothetical protein